MPEPITYECTGINKLGGRCRRKLLLYRAGTTHGDLGRIEVKCSRCDTINYIHLGQSVPRDVANAAKTASIKTGCNVEVVTLQS